jgi:hypothetical protein
MKHDDQPLPALDSVREEERPTPVLAEPPPFTLTAETDDAEDAYQRSLFNGPALDFHE